MTKMGIDRTLRYRVLWVQIVSFLVAEPQLVQYASLQARVE
jgi:hypothetical protein